jgi:curved DNA-binding protein CbpA
LTRNYYELLGVGATAEPEEIKRAFRREIARYHPDKVQHLGHEFQEIASVRAAALTEAYRILMDDQARRRYDDGDGKGTRATASAPPRPAAPTAPHVPSHRPAAYSDPADGADEKLDSRVQQTRETTSTFVKKASLGMLREAVSLAAAGVMELPAPGFDAAYVVKGKHRLFSGKEPVVRLLARFVPHVTPAAVAEVWPLAAAAATKDQIACVLLLGVGLAPSKELSTAVAEQRRKTRSAGPVIVPVDVRDWDALLPPEIPASARAILQQLKDGKR